MSQVQGPAVKQTSASGRPVTSPKKTSFDKSQILRFLNSQNHTMAVQAASLINTGDVQFTSDDVSDLCKALKSDVHEVIIAAANALGNIGPDAEEAIRHLYKLTSHHNGLINKAAQDAQAKILQTSNIEILRERLKTGNAQERLNSVIVLGKMKATQAVPDLLAILLNEPDTKGTHSITDDICKAAIEVLGNMGDEGTCVLGSALSSSQSSTVYICSASKLSDMKAVSTLRAVLKESKSSKGRKFAAWGIGKMKATQAIPDLLSALDKEQDDNARTQFVRTLGNISTENDTEVVTCLVNRLQSDRSSEVRSQAADRLGDLKPDSAFSYLLRALKIDLSNDVKKTAIFSITKFKTRVHEAISDIVTLLKYGCDVNLRAVAAESLGKIKAQEAVPALVAIILTFDERLANTCANALSKIGDSTIEPIVHALKEKSFSDQEKIIELFGHHEEMQGKICAELCQATAS